MTKFNLGGIVSTVFILLILVTIIVVFIRSLGILFSKNNLGSTQNTVDELSMRINKLEKQVEELQKKSL